MYYSSDPLYRDNNVLHSRKIYALTIFQHISNNQINLVKVNHNYETRNNMFFTNISSKTIGCRCFDYLASL